MRRILAISVLALLAILFWTPNAGAGSGKFTDLAKDVFNQDKQTAGSGRVDILGVDFADDGHTATYTIHTKSGFNTSDIHAIWVYLQDLDGLTQDDCPRLAAWAKYVNDRLETKLTQCLGSGREKEYGGVAMTHADGDKKITVTVDIDVLRAAGFTGSGYSFKVEVLEEGKESIRDEAPNLYLQRHELSYPNPEPTQAPSQALSTTASDEPTPDPSPKSSKTDKNADTSFAAPENSGSSGGGGLPIVVVALGGGLAAVGSGVAFYRFWPLLRRHF